MAIPPTIFVLTGNGTSPDFRAGHRTHPFFVPPLLVSIPRCLFTAYVVVGTPTAVANAGISALDFARHKRVLTKMAEVGGLKAAGALGLLLKNKLRPTAAAVLISGAPLMPVGAITTHQRARNYPLGYPATYRLPAAALPALDLAT